MMMMMKQSYVQTQKPHTQHVQLANDSNAQQNPENTLTDSLLKMSPTNSLSGELMLSVNIEDTLLDMKVDTGSTVTMISTADHE